MGCMLPLYRSPISIICGVSFSSLPLVYPRYPGVVKSLCQYTYTGSLYREQMSTYRKE